jgi:M6 family metalloprotease-like protein
LEVSLKRICTLILFVSLLFGERLTIIRNTQNHPPQDPPQADFMVKLVNEMDTQTMPVHRYQPLRLYKNFNMHKPKQTSDRAVVNVLAIRVEFETDNDSLTTGDGTMDLVGFGEPEDGLYYDRPHDKIYFERQMQFLSNYYKSNTFGHVEVEYTVKPDGDTVSYQLPHKMEYYSGYDHYDESSGYVYFNTYAMEMGLVRVLVDAIAQADQDPSIDFSDYDEIVIFHAGCLFQTSLNFYRFRDLPAATIPAGALDYYLGIPYILANAGTDTIREAGINSEMARVDEYMVGIAGTIIHEFGHSLGLPDLYDITGWSNGVGSFCLMGTGGWVGDIEAGAPEGIIPTNLSAWCRYDRGWVNPVVVTNPDTSFSLRATSIDTTQYSVADQTLIKIPISSTEFFLIENRQQDIRSRDTIIIDAEDHVVISVDYGEYDFFLPGSGILIWHIDDEVVSIWTDSGYNVIQIDPDHKGVDLEEADGIQHFDAWWYGDAIEYYGSEYDLFFVDDSNLSNTEFGPFTNPNSDSYYGKSMVDLDILSERDTIMDVALDFDFYQDGFPVQAQYNQPIKSVSYGDLDNNGDIEVIVATKIGGIFCFNHDGTSYGYYSRYNPITSFLAIGDINNDGADDIIFARDKELICLDGLTVDTLPGFSFSADDEILGAPLIFDLDNDGSDEIIVGSKDYHLYCLDATGTNIPNFPLTLNTWLLSTPCVFKQEERQIGVLGSDGRFWLIDAQGIIKEFTDSEHNMLTFASPVCGDLDRDGQPEAVIINGFGTIYIYGEDSLEQWFDILIDTTFYMTPGLADIDRDGYLEIIMANSSSTFYVTNRNGTMENNFPIYSDANIFYPILAADLDSDNKEELTYGLGSYDTSAVADSFGYGQLKIIHDRNEEFLFSPLYGEKGFSSPGIIFDLDDDGDLELACGSNFGTLYIWDFPGTEVSWSGFMNSPKNWGLYNGLLADPQSRSGLLGLTYIYPSPVERNGRVRFFLNQEAEVTVDILDITGHKIGSETINDATANEYNEIAFDFSMQANGVYILRVEANNGSTREVKHKKFAVLK